MIHIDKPITLLLPFHRAALQVSHRLLDNLGHVSRFMLHALAHKLTLSQLVEITDLTPTGLVRQLRFLKQFDFVNIDDQSDPPAFTLSDRGVQMLRIEELLKEFEPVVWLDTFTLNRDCVHLVASTGPMSAESAYFLRNPQDSDFANTSLLRLPERSKTYHHFDQINRVRHLLEGDGLCDLLRHYWPDDINLVSDESDYWQCTLASRGADVEPDYLQVVFDANELVLRPRAADALAQKSCHGLPWIAVPALRLTYRFRRTESFPWPVTVPPDDIRSYEKLGYGALPDFAPQAPSTMDGVAMFSVSDDTPMPASITGTAVPPGLDVSLEVADHAALCGMDHTALTHKLHTFDDLLLLSRHPYGHGAIA